LSGLRNGHMLAVGGRHIQKLQIDEEILADQDSGEFAAPSLVLRGSATEQPLTAIGTLTKPAEAPALRPSLGACRTRHRPCSDARDRSRGRWLVARRAERAPAGDVIERTEKPAGSKAGRTLTGAATQP